MDASEQVQAVATRLRERGPIAARGVACIEVLLRDGSGPIYDMHSRQDLPSLLEKALAAMDDPVTI